MIQQELKYCLHLKKFSNLKSDIFLQILHNKAEVRCMIFANALTADKILFIKLIHCTGTKVLKLCFKKFSIKEFVYTYFPLNSNKACDQLIKKSENYRV